MKSAADDEALSFTDVSVTYDHPRAQALRGVGFAQRRGELVAVLGASGAGKSTLLKCANRTVPELQRGDVRGRVRVLGRPTEGLRVAELAGQIGFVFQDFEAQLFSTSVREEILFGLEQLGVAPGEMPVRVADALRAVGLEGFDRRDPTSLSGGEKQRLAIAAVLALRPALLLLDEPSTDLDPAGARDILGVLARLRVEGTTLLVAEHDAASVSDADRLLVLEEGRVLRDGPPAAVFADPRALGAAGVRPPEVAVLCERLGLDVWPLELDAVEARLRAAGISVRRSGAAAPAPAAGEVLLQVRGVRFRHPQAERDALCGIDVEIRAGEMLAVVGSNGSGKSTLARHLNGLLEPASGSVLWRGRPIGSLRAAERACAVGYVFQNPDEQIFAATVAEEVAFGPKHLGCAAAEIDGRVREAIDAVGLGGLEARDPFLLGKGERQRVAVAAVLALRPRVLVLDEPTTGLDFRERTALLATLERLNRGGCAVVLITHVPWVVAGHARRVILMSEGEILWDGGVRELFARDDLCRRGAFVPNEVARLGRRLGAAPLTVDEFLGGLA